MMGDHTGAAAPGRAATNRTTCRRKGIPPMRGRSAAAALALLMLLAACGGEQDEDKRKASSSRAEAADEASITAATGASDPSPAPSPTGPLVDIPPAASAGGLCRKVTYSQVARALDVRFDVAAASGDAGATQVCVLQRVGFSAPDLTLSRIPLDKPDPADEPEPGTKPETPEEIFKADYQPEAAKKVTGLGKAAYSRVLAGKDGGGAQVEVGWLAAETVDTLVYTTSPDTTPQEAAKEVARVITLARQIAR